MAAVSNSVIHLTMRFNSTVLSHGTGVLYERNEQYYIVTAWHNLTGLHTESLKHLSSKCAVPNNIIASLNIHHLNVGITNLSISIPLMDDEKSLFYIHPKNWPRVDVVAVPFDPTNCQIEINIPGEAKRISQIDILAGPPGVKTELCPVQKFLVPDISLQKKWMDTVEVTEEVFIPGYPHNIQDYYSQPVWKRATIASSVQMGWNDQPKFLVDSASASGMSGAPVFYYSPNGEVRIMGVKHRHGRDVAILAGIYVGRVGVNKDADPQVGTVWHSKVIDEIIDGKYYEQLPENIKVSSQDLRIAIKKALSHCSQGGLDNVKNPDMPSRFYVLQNVLELVKGCADPEVVLSEILEVAEHYDGPLVVE